MMSPSKNIVCLCLFSAFGCVNADTAKENYVNWLFETVNTTDIEAITVHESIDCGYLYIFVAKNNDKIVGIGRIDRVAKRDVTPPEFRYVFWNSGKTMAEEPDIALYNGTLEVLGSASNLYYEFKNNGYTYKFTDSRNCYSEQDGAFSLSVEKGETVLCTYKIDIIRIADNRIKNACSVLF